MALLKLDLHLFHKDARKMSLITVDVQKDFTVQHVLQHITSIYEISCDDESSGIALFSEGFFIHPSLPSSALLVLPGTLLVRPVRVIAEPSSDGKRGKKRRIELLDEDPGDCCPSTSQRNSSPAVLLEGQGCLASLPACGVCCHCSKVCHVRDSAAEIRSMKNVLEDGPVMQPPKKKRKKCTIDCHEKNIEYGIHLHSTPKVFPKENETVCDEHYMPKKKSKKKRKKGMASCDETVGEITTCNNLDGSNSRMFEDEEGTFPLERKSVKDGKKTKATHNKVVEEATECGDLDRSYGRRSVEEKSGEPSRRNSVRNKNCDVSVRQSTSVSDEIDEYHSKIEKSLVENIKTTAQTPLNYLGGKSIPKSAASSSNGTTRLHHEDDDVCLQQTKGHSSSQVHHSSVVDSRTETLLDCGSKSDHSHAISNVEESINETNGTVMSSTIKRKRKRKHNKRLKREKKRLRVLFLGNETAEMPVEQQHERQKDMQQMVEKYLKRDSAMLATDAIDSEERREYETQLKSVPKLGTKPGKVRIMEGNKFKREKCGIVTFQGKTTTFHSSNELASNIDEEASATVSANTKVESDSNFKEDVDCGQARIKSTLKSFLDRRLQKTLMQNDSTPSILSNGNFLSNNQSQSDLQLDLFEVKVAHKDPLLKDLGATKTSSSSVNPLVECSHLPTNMAMIRSCAEKSIQYANQPVQLDEEFSILRDIENSREVSVFKYKRRETNTSHQDEVSVDEISDSSCDDSIPVSMHRRKKADDGVRFPFRAPPNATPFPPESDEIRSDFFFLGSIENSIEPLVYYRYNAYGKDVSSDGNCENDGQINDAPSGNYCALESKQTTDLVSNEGDMFMTKPARVIVKNIKPEGNGNSMSLQTFSVDAIVHHNKVSENDASQSIVSDYDSCGRKCESQSQLLNGSQTCSAQEKSSASLPYATKDTEVQNVSSCSASESKDCYIFAGDPPCPKSLEKSIVSSVTKLNSVGAIQSPLCSYEWEAMAGAASVHTGKLQCLQPISKRQSKGFKPRVYSAMGSLLQQLRNKASTKEKASAIVGEGGSVLDGVEGTATSCRKHRTLTEVPNENNAAYGLHGLESFQDKSNISCSIPLTERKMYLDGNANENRPNDNRFNINSKLENFLCVMEIPKKKRGQRIRKRKSIETQKPGSAVPLKIEPFQSLWDVTPEEYNARHMNAQTTLVESNIQNPSNDSNSHYSPGLPSVLSNIDVANLPQVCGMPHVGDIVFFYVDDESYTSDDRPTKTPSVNGNQDAKTSGDSGAFLNGYPTTNAVNPLTTCLPVDMDAQRSCQQTSNGEQPFVPVVGKVLTVSEEVVTLQLIGNSSDSASVGHSEPVINRVECDETYNSSGVEKTVLWSRVACPKLVFP